MTMNGLCRSMAQAVLAKNSEKEMFVMTYKELLNNILESICDPSEIDGTVYGACLYEVGIYFDKGNDALSFPDSEIDDEDLTADDEEELDRRVRLTLEDYMGKE